MKISNHRTSLLRSLFKREQHCLLKGEPAPTNADRRVFLFQTVQTRNQPVNRRWDGHYEFYSWLSWKLRAPLIVPKTARGTAAAKSETVMNQIKSANVLKKMRSVISKISAI